MYKIIDYPDGEVDRVGMGMELYRYVKCPECKTEIQTENPIKVKLPYCGSCGMYVADAAHKFCGFCGVHFDGKV